ncbi:MAG: AAA-associated domain-containing protein [Nitrososphaerota archaeon]|nr:AAA-associated domain-containing protein [Nitrososphaerota archaeon]MDG6938880.1 AAA-associated domain-containing protein [Nitrososphaerota archaeon]
MLFPADVKASQLTTFLRVISYSGGTMDVARVADELDMDLTRLIPILDAAEMLCLVKVEKGEVKLSKAGQDLLSVRKGRLLRIREALTKVEPFRTAVAMRGRFTADELAQEMEARSIRWHHEDEVNHAIVDELLIHWGIYAGLVDYDGSSSTFTVRPYVSRE